jgi:hypothetical protein
MATERDQAQAPRKPWTPPTLKYVGDVTEVLKGGGGKLTPTFDDPGEGRKPKGQE